MIQEVPCNMVPNKKPQTLDYPPARFNLLIPRFLQRPRFYPIHLRAIHFKRNATKGTCHLASPEKPLTTST